MPTSPSPARPVSYPPRDADGRIATLPDLLGGVAFSMILGTVILVALDGIFTLLGAGTFGHVSGWLAGILVVFMFAEDFRAWKAAPLRPAIALVGLVLGVVAGALLGPRIDRLTALFAGAISVTLAAVIYALIWYFGIRFVVGRLGER